MSDDDRRLDAVESQPPDQEPERTAAIADVARGAAASEAAKDLRARAEDDSALQADLAIFEHLSEAVKTRPTPERASELVWARLARSIAADEQARAETRRARYWRIAAMALAAVALGQLALMLSATTDAPEDGVYITASQAETATSLKVAFMPSASEGEIRTLLRSVNGEIVSGPSALGLYTVRFSDTKAMERAELAFRDATTVVDDAARTQ
ncbi:MAG: hypothetical protein AAF527_01075 [Pseudomonadota bacterium]